MIRPSSCLCPLLLLFAVASWLGGCASPVPERLQRPPTDNPVLHEVRADPQRFRGRDVRWGGEIIEVRNKAEHSDLLILARALDDDGEPRSGSQAKGRFIARIDRFVDPADYEEGQRLTVFGSIAGALTDPVGDYPYRYPVVDVADWYRWTEKRRVAYGPGWYHDPFYYSPFYDPFYDPWWPRRYGWPYHHPFW